MNEVPHKYRNVINPWQTEREIKSAIKQIEKMLKFRHKSLEEELTLLRTNEPTRYWGKLK